MYCAHLELLRLTRSTALIVVISKFTGLFHINYDMRFRPLFRGRVGQLKHHNDSLHALSRRLDPLWWLTARLLRLGPHGAGPRVPQSILVVDLHLLGDLVMLVPLLRVIRRFHPHAHLGLVSGPWGRDILADSGLVDEFITLRAPWVIKGQGAAGFRGLLRAIKTSRARSWDWGIDVRGDVRNALLLAFARARRRVAYDFSGGAALLTDVVPDDGQLRHIIDHHAAIAEYLGMPMTAKERIPALGSPERIGSGTHGCRLIGFHFGASMVLRRMPLEEACALLLAFQDREDTRLILVDAPDVRALNSAVLARLSPKSAAKIERWQGNLSELIAFLKTLDQFYAMDSGPAHLAAALGIDTTVFFGPHLSLAVRPKGRNVTVVERADVPCRPCDQHHCTNLKHQECLTQVVRLLGRARSQDAPFEPSSSAAGIRLVVP
jgi:ADP-heptose:LPS heptosyltransferase